MKASIYNELRAKLKTKYDHDIKSLTERYALSNNSVKIGDIISDQTKTITVAQIIPACLLPDPCCIYIGPTYPSGKGRGRIYQTNIRERKTP